MPDAPLSGIVVLDLTQNLPGPYAVSLLVDLGAEVTKVEAPKGDPARFAGALYERLNRGKTVITLDLVEPAGRAEVHRLAERADVVVESFRPGVMARLGCDAASLLAINPRLIYCSVSAFGQHDPRASLPGHDLNLQALAGLCHLERDARGTPRATVLPVADLSAGMDAAMRICAALRAREHTGEGAVIDVSMQATITDWVAIWDRGIDFAGKAREELGARAEGPLGAIALRAVRILGRTKLYAIPHYGLFRARDGQWLALGIVDEEHFWRELAALVGLHPRLARLRLPARIAAGPLLRAILARRFASADRDAWVERLVRAGLPATPVR